MMDLLDGFAPSPSTENNGPVYPSITAFESSSLRLTFNFSKQPGNPQTTVIQATFMNLSSNTYTDFVFQAAVPKFLQLHLDPASSITLPAAGNGSITQNLKITNSQHGKKSLVMRMRIAYKTNGKDTLEEGQINNFPRDL
ncbi:AP-1 complex subunit gamma-1 [Spatholobus suberectus]|nr:AP-1 complex subunit gamma-1 [Spatholobus suberectus]